MAACRAALSRYYLRQYEAEKCHDSDTPTAGTLCALPGPVRRAAAGCAADASGTHSPLRCRLPPVPSGAARARAAPRAALPTLVSRFGPGLRLSTLQLLRAAELLSGAAAAAAGLFLRGDAAGRLCAGTRGAGVGNLSLGARRLRQTCRAGCGGAHRLCALSPAEPALSRGLRRSLGIGCAGLGALGVAPPGVAGRAQRLCADRALHRRADAFAQCDGAAGNAAARRLCAIAGLAESRATMARASGVPGAGVGIGPLGVLLDPGVARTVLRANSPDPDLRLPRAFRVFRRTVQRANAHGQRRGDALRAPQRGLDSAAAGAGRVHSWKKGAARCRARPQMGVGGSLPRAAGHDAALLRAGLGTAAAAELHSVPLAHSRPRQPRPRHPWRRWPQRPSRPILQVSAARAGGGGAICSHVAFSALRSTPAAAHTAQPHPHRICHGRIGHHYGGRLSTDMGAGTSTGRAGGPIRCSGGERLPHSAPG